VPAILIQTMVRGRVGNSIIIRAREGDCAELSSVAATAFFAAYAGETALADLEAYIAENLTEEVFAAALALPDHHVFVVTIAEQIVGYCHYVEHDPPSHSPLVHALELKRIYLLPEAIGKGLGSQMVAHCRDFAKSRGYAHLWLSVWERNLRALAFYEKNGFTELGFEDFLVGDDLQRDKLLSCSA
jgi:diamine N-acetyltransferase